MFFFQWFHTFLHIKSVQLVNYHPSSVCKLNFDSYACSIWNGARQAVDEQSVPAVWRGRPTIKDSSASTQQNFLEEESEKLGLRMSAVGANSFGVTNYVVFALMLGVSACIGVYFAWVDRRKNSSGDFLTAGRTLTALPVSMSLTASAMSAITVLSNPAEVR